jgi:hypothetical protein
VPRRYAFVDPSETHGCNRSIQARGDFLIGCCAQQRFFLGPPFRRGAPHAEDVPLGPRMTDTGQGMSRATHDLFIW